MKLNSLVRAAAALLLMFCLFSAPLAATTMPDKGDKNFKQGLKYETAEQWDKAAEEYALAVAANPKNAEFKLHYRRALFNAGQMMMQRGRTLSEQKDFVGAYNAFRAAFGYDPTNELAKSEMDRMVRLQQGVERDQDPNNPNQPKESPTKQPPAVKLVPTAYTGTNGTPQQDQQDSPQVEQLRNVKFATGDLRSIIRDLARELDLNVLFDKQTFSSPKTITPIDLNNVTTAQGLDAIFLQEGLFFQKVGRRTILVADQNRRQNFQQLVLRTFYLANAKPEDAQKVVQQAIPPQPGRPPSQVIIDKDTNSVTVRDTVENIRIIGNLIKSLDKDRAEVVMDVNIYEVSKNDLLQLGAQIGDANSLVNLGGTNAGAVGIGNTGGVFGARNTAGGATSVFNRAIGTGILLPSATIQALQSKGNARLLASTQVHAFNNQDSEARIGQRVPVRSAQILGYNGNGTTGGNGASSPIGYNNAAAVYNYEQVGLTLKFKPTVYPNQDVQVDMSIESKDVAAGGVDQNPTFTERTIKGTARIQNNRTLLLASVAQDSQTNSQVGLPILGLIPVLGRLFSAPQKNNRQVDIVIAVTPRVIRAPAILPEDEIERETGSIAVPTSSSLSEMVRREDAEDRIAAARRLPTNPVVQLPDQQAQNQTDAVAATKTQSDFPTTAATTITTPFANVDLNQPSITPKLIDANPFKTLNVVPTADKTEDQPSSPAPQSSSAELKIENLGVLQSGEKRRVAVTVNSPSALRMSVLSLNFDQSKIAVRKISYGAVFGASNNNSPQFTVSNGMLMAMLPPAADTLAQGAGVLAYVEIEALTEGNPNLRINRAASSLVGTNGEMLTLR